MVPYLAIAVSRVDPGWLLSGQTPRHEVTATLAEYKYLAESIAAQYGSIHSSFGDNGHLFLFENVDAAVQFALRLMAEWDQRVDSMEALSRETHVPLAIGCHFGECTKIGDSDSWAGRGIDLARQVAGSSSPDTVTVTASVLDLLDLPMYRFEEAGDHQLEGDHLPSRPLFQITVAGGGSAEVEPRDPTTAEAWFLRAAALIGTARENSDEEAAYYARALELRPDYPQAHNNLGVLYRLRGDESKATEHYREALRLRPDYAEANYNHAVLLQSSGRLGGAAEHYEAALRLRHDYLDAHYGYATLLAATGDLTRADRHYREALSLRPEYAEVHNNFAILQEDMAAPELAERHYREALRIRPDYAEAHYNLAFLLENQGAQEGASHHYREALRIRPSYAEAHNNLAILLQGQGDLAGAALHYQKAMALRPDVPQTH